MKRKIGDTWYDLPEGTEAQAARLGNVLGGITGRIDEWMSCRRCGCGALAHGYDEPSQRCLCGKCAGYRTRLASRNERSEVS
jgi:hypothetical protein